MVRLSRGKRTVHNFIRKRRIKCAAAIDAIYVLVRHGAGSEVNANVDFLLHFTVRAFNRHHDEARLFRHRSTAQSVAARRDFIGGFGVLGGVSARRVSTGINSASALLLDTKASDKI
jgi:hypothetical protein